MRSPSQKGSPAETRVTVDPLPSWNDGPAKTAIVDFVRSALDETSPNYVPEEDRIATFDQDGTMWVEHPLYSQLQFAFARVVDLAAQHPEWKTTAPFASILSGDKAAIAKFAMPDLLALVAATHAGMTTQEFAEIASAWIGKARHPRWNRPYTDLVFAPMLEVMRFLGANGFAVYLVTGGGQAFVRTFGRGVLTKQPDVPVHRRCNRKAGADQPIPRQAPARGVRQLDRRPADAGIHAGQCRCALDDARAARRPRA